MRAFTKFSTVFLSLVLIYSATWFVAQKFSPPGQPKPKTMIDYTPLGSIKDFPEERMSIDRNFNKDSNVVSLESTADLNNPSQKIKNKHNKHAMKRSAINKAKTGIAPVTHLVTSDRSQDNILDMNDSISTYLHSK